MQPFQALALECLDSLLHISTIKQNWYYKGLVQIVLHSILMLWLCQTLSIVAVANPILMWISVELRSLEMVASKYLKLFTLLSHAPFI